MSYSANSYNVALVIVAKPCCSCPETLWWNQQRQGHHRTNVGTSEAPMVDIEMWEIMAVMLKPYAGHVSISRLQVYRVVVLGWRVDSRISGIAGYIFPVTGISAVRVDIVHFISWTRRT